MTRMSRHTALLLLIFFVTIPGSADGASAAAGLPSCDLRAALGEHLPPAGKFAQLPGGTFAQAMFSREEARRMQIDAPFGPRAVVTSWNGAAFDGCRMYFKGGGHRSYGGNEVYAYDFQAMRFERLNDPAPLVIEVEKGCPIPEPRHGPYSGHTWDGLIHGGGKLYTWESSGYCRAPGKALNKLFVHAAFDLAARRWETATYRSDRHKLRDFVAARSLGRFRAEFTHADGSRSVVDWSRSWFKTTATAPAPGGGIVSLRPERGWVSLMDPASGKTVCPERPLAAGASGGVLARVGDKLVYNGGVWQSRTRIRFHEVRFDKAGCPIAWTGPAAVVELPPEARSSLPLWAKPIVWHPPSDSIVMWNGREQFWAFDAQDYALRGHWAVDVHPTPKQSATTPVYSKMHYVPDLDAFAMYVNPDERMWLYRLPEDLADGAAGQRTGSEQNR